MKIPMSVRFLLCVAILAICASSARAEGEAPFLKVPVGVNYTSTYWWRGIELNGKGNGVIWPSMGLVFGDTGLSAVVAAGLNADYLIYQEEGDQDAAKTFNEFDYGLSYGTAVGDLVTLGAGVTYIQYYFHDALDGEATNPSFVEGWLSLELKLPFSPRLDAYYDYYVEENRDAEDNPRDEDYYLKLSVSRDLLDADGFKFTAGAWVAYYRNAYFDAIGWSDAGIKFSTAKGYGKAAFTASVNYARSLSNDFQREAPVDTDGNGETSVLRNHFWAEFGASSTL